MINRGKFTGDYYYKTVSFSKAVLWKDKQLSLPKFIIIGFTAHKTNKAVFSDRGKGERWVFKVEDILSKGEWKTVGQEKQLYFPIEMAKKEVIK